MTWRSSEISRIPRVWWWLLGICLLLLAARLAAPALIAGVVRRSIDQMEGGYHGDIEGVELSVLGAEVAILGLRIEKQNGKVPVPFMHVKRFVLGVQRDGFRLLQKLRLVSPNVSFVDAESKAAEQFGPKFELIELREQLPLELGAVYMEGGQVHFRNFEAEPPVDVYAQELEFAWDGLADCLPPGRSTCRSSLRGKGQVMGSGGLRLEGAYNRRRGSNFEVAAQLRNLKIEQLNPMLVKYVQIDAQRGSADFTVLHDQRDERQSLAIIPRLHEVKVMGGDRERTAWFRELAAGLAAGFFERRSGSKAITYEKSGAGKGKWSVVDWPRQRAQASAERGG